MLGGRERDGLDGERGQRYGYPGVVTSAFKYVLKHNQSKLIPYLIEVSEELVFEREMAAYRASLLPQLAKQTA